MSTPAPIPRLRLPMCRTAWPRRRSRTDLGRCTRAWAEIPTTRQASLQRSPRPTIRRPPNLAPLTRVTASAVRCRLLKASIRCSPTIFRSCATMAGTSRSSSTTARATSRKRRSRRSRPIGAKAGFSRTRRWGSTHTARRTRPIRTTTTSSSTASAPPMARTPPTRRTMASAMPLS
jgi:hypothetical protein